MPLRLVADQQHGGPIVPEPAFQMVPDPAGIAHAARRDDDVKAGQLCDRFALVDGFGEAQVVRIEQAIDVDGGIETRGVASEDLGGVNRERENRERSARSGISPWSIRSTRSTISSWVRSTAKAGISSAPSAAAASRTSPASRCRRCWASGGGPEPVAIGRFRNHVIEAAGRFRIGFEQFAIGTNVAGEQHAYRAWRCAGVGDFEFDRCGAEQMPCVPVTCPDPGDYLAPRLVVDRLERSSASIASAWV